MLEFHNVYPNWYHRIQHKLIPTIVFFDYHWIVPFHWIHYYCCDLRRCCYHCLIDFVPTVAIVTYDLMGVNSIQLVVMCDNLFLLKITFCLFFHKNGNSVLLSYHIILNTNKRKWIYNKKEKTKKKKKQLNVTTA